MTEAQQKRFWSKVDKSTDCWNWMAGRDKDGYGKVGVDYTDKRAHRISWELANGKSAAGLQVCHRCDRPSCVNPEHLFLGTQLDNSTDMKVKGRAASGARNGMALNPTHSHFAKVKFIFAGEANAEAKLTEKQVLEIRARYVPRKVGLEFLAKEYGVSFSNIHRIVKRQNWRNV